MIRIHRLLKASIAKNMLGGFLLVIIPTLILGFLSDVVGIRVSNNEISNSYNNSITLLSQQMADRLNNLDMLASSILLDDDLIEISNSKGAPPDLFEYSLFQKRMLLYRTPQFVDANMTVCLPRQGWLISTNSGISKLNNEDVALSGIKPGDFIWSIRRSVMNPSVECLSVYRGYVYEKQSSPFIFMEISGSETKKVLATMAKNTHVLQTFFLDPFGNYLSTGKNLDEELIQKLKAHYTDHQDDENKQQTVTYGGKTYRLLYQNVGDYHCKIGMLFDESELLRPVVNIWIISVVFMFFAVSASLLFINITYRKIITPVRSLTKAMLELEAGNLGTRVEIAPHNEFSVMSRQFNKMVEQLDHLIKDSYVKELKLKNAELRFLRSQINPHFLYNSLFSIYNMIQNGELESASDMAVYLGRYYQRSAHFNERELAIEDEIQNIRTYVQIMAIRFPERLHLVTEIGHQTNQLKIPVLSLQTIVENAILHGMEGSSRMCTITIETHLEGAVLHLSIRDTGKGMAEDQLEVIRERLYHSMETDDRHGLENVYMRLKLMYGQEVSMTISQNDPVGTRVDIHIPLKEGDIVV